MGVIVLSKSYATVYFSIWGENFPVELFTKEVGINPTEFYYKGDEYIRGETVRVRNISTWDFYSNSQKILDGSEQIDCIINTLSSAVEVINRFKKQYNLQCQFSIVLHFSEYQTPGLHLDYKHVQFAEAIGASFDIDIYNISDSEGEK